MIVTQYGRLPGGEAGAALSGGPARQSTAVDQLQRYYGTGDTALRTWRLQTRCGSPHLQRRYGDGDAASDPGELKLGASRTQLQHCHGTRDTASEPR